MSPMYAKKLVGGDERLQADQELFLLLGQVEHDFRR